jgi:hypothetical protein
VQTALFTTVSPTKHWRSFPLTIFLYCYLFVLSQATFFERLWFTKDLVGHLFSVNHINIASMKKFLPLALLASATLTFSSCDKADQDIAPSTTSSVQEVAKNKLRGLQVDVTGVVNARQFTATLRIEDFYASGGQIFANVYLERIKGANLTKTELDQIEGADFVYNVISRSWSNSSLAVEVYPYTNTTNLGTSLQLTSAVVVVDSNVPRYDVLMANGTLGQIVNWFAAPTTIEQLVVLYNQVAQTVGAR